MTVYCIVVNVWTNQDWRPLRKAIGLLGEAKEFACGSWLVITRSTMEEVQKSIEAIKHDRDLYLIVTVTSVCGKTEFDIIPWVNDQLNHPQKG